MSTRVYVSLFDANGKAIETKQAVQGRNAEVFAFNSGKVHKPIDKATGKITGNRQYEPISLTKAVCPATPIIFKAITKSEKLAKVEVHYYRPNEDTGTEEEFFCVTMEDVQVVSQALRVLDTAAQGVTHIPTVEDIEMTAERITQAHKTPHMAHTDEYRKKDNVA
ncbi:MAG: type VI secretion system tube protein TssD [Gammaproteobacteria bacterium]